MIYGISPGKRTGAHTYARTHAHPRRWRGAHTHKPQTALQSMRAQIGMRAALCATHEKPPTHE